MSGALSIKELSDAERFQLLIDAVTDYAIYMLDNDGFVASWNSGAERITGYTASEAIGQHFSQFFTEEDRQRGAPADLLHTALTNGRSEGERWRTRKDGGRYWASVLVEAIRGEKGELLGYAEITRDITERRAAHEALRESEKQFSLLVESVSDYALFMLDPSGIVISWNKGAERLKGYSAAEIIGHHFSRFYTKEDRADGRPARVLDTAAREGRYESEGWRVRKDGSRFWASAVLDAIRSESGELLGFAKITRDITERRAAQEALRESERQFRMLVAGVTDYALYMLDPNGIVTNWNSGGERIKGYSASEIVGQHFSRFYTDADRAAGMPARALYTAAHEGRFEAEGWRMRKDGSLFWANVVIDAIKDEDGKLIGFAKITRDITERRETQLALEKAQAQRDYAQKMEALGQLTGGVAHDFNNLLMIISGHVHSLKKLAAEDPKAARATEAIELAARRGESLTRQLLSFARRQTLNPVVVEIGERLEAVRSMLASSLGRASAVVMHVAPDLWPVRIDLSEFELAIVNIALNSRDAMPDGGMITIQAENVSLGSDDTAAHLEGDFVALTVADTGAGIAPDILPRVFDPFFTTKQMSNGTGLGLSQVHGFAHQSGGTVTIDSELGRGTRITIFLPRAHAKPVAEAPESATVETAPSGTVLLVEDNPEVAEVTVALLEQLGFDVEATDSAEKANEIVEQRKFDLIVSDIVMAGPMDGLGLARAVRERHPELPILLVTGYTNTAALADAEFTVLRKPYRLADLSRAVAQVIAGPPDPPPDNLVHLRQVRRGSSQPGRA